MIVERMGVMMLENINNSSMMENVTAWQQSDSKNKLDSMFDNTQDNTYHSYIVSTLYEKSIEGYFSPSNPPV